MASTSTNKDTKTRPAHHHPNGKGFVNPWPSFHKHEQLKAVKLFCFEFDWKRTTITKETKLPTILNLDKTLIDSLSHPKDGVEHGARHSKVATTWLGQ